MTSKHKHYDVIVAWAEGKPIQFKSECGSWKDFKGDIPSFMWFDEWRVKPEKVKWCGIGTYSANSYGEGSLTINFKPNNYFKIDISELQKFSDSLTKWLEEYNEKED
jgi:hypothetical protein